jgi:hypothetical protein
MARPTDGPGEVSVLTGTCPPESSDPASGLPIDTARLAPLGRDGARLAPPGSILDADLTRRLAAYKRQVAGRYQSHSPGELGTALPAGPALVSPKIDGECWFLLGRGGTEVLLSPNGRVITGAPLLQEAERRLGEESVLLAGELYAEPCNGRGRPRGGAWRRAVASGRRRRS